MNKPKSVPGNSTCTRCQAPATLPCVGCQDAPILDPQIHSASYCNISCYEADKDKHEETCKQLQVHKLFYRAGDILQEIFYVYKEKIFLRKILSVKVMENGDVGLTMDNMDNPKQMAMMPTFAELFQKFPGNKCGSRGARKAVLTYNAGSDAVAWMHDMVKYLLDGIAVNIEEISLEPKNHRRQVIDLDPKQEPQEGSFKRYHDIFKVEIKNGEVYALDLAGAQFGYYNPVTPWEEYFTTRVEQITQRDNWEEYQHFGGLKKMHVKESKDLSSIDMFQFSQFAGLNCCASEILEETLWAWLKQHRLTAIEEVLDLPRDTYQIKRKELLKKIGEDLEAFVSRTRVNLAPLRALKAARGCAQQ